MGESLLSYDRVQEHLTGLVPKRPDILVAMEAEAERTDFPIIGPAAGQACYQLARMIGARKVFEMGSGFGYSTAWFARAVAENGGGEVHHVVWDAALSDRARSSLTELGYGGIVRYHVAEAVQTLRETEEKFDLIFNDIDKEAYASSLPLIAEKLRSGGLLIVDNLLWDGRIFDPGNHSPSTEAIRELTRLVSGDPAWISTILPIRDGLLVAWKR
jgi:predicted O-methyltransferase YrrM